MKLDHLSTDPNPLPRDTQIAEREVDHFLVKCRTLLADDEASFALETITGILTTVEQTRRLTLPQRVAIQNIEDAVERKKAAQEDGRPRDAGRWGRRYEGWGR